MFLEKMIFRINNKLTEENGKWRYRGVVTYNATVYEITGLVPRLGTQGMTKRAIMEDMAEQVLNRLDKGGTKTKSLTVDNNFVAT